MHRITGILLAAVLAGCGGAAATDTSSAPPAGGAADGYGQGVQTVRDVSTASGGNRGNVNTATMARTITGAGETAFEWVALHILDNHSAQGENVATYSQANKLSTGPTWAAVSEATDTAGLSGGLVAHEFDVFTTGPDNGNRIGLDIVSGDARAVRGLGKSLQADATAAIRIGQTAGHPWAAWSTGILLQGNYRDSVLKIVTPDGRTVLDIRPDGTIWRDGRLIL